MNFLSPYLVDAIEQVVTDPTGLYQWENLLNQLHQNQTQEAHQLAYEHIRDRISDEGIAGFHRATFIHHIFGIEQERSSAGKILEKVRPIHIERLMAYINYEWGKMVTQVSNAAEFQTAVEALNFKPLLNLVASTLSTKESTQRTYSQNIQRIAIYAPQINDRYHPPTNLVLEHAALLTELGYDTKIFSCQEYALQHNRKYLSNGGQVVNAPFDENYVQQLSFKKPIEITRANTDLSLATRYAYIFAGLEEFDPDVVLFIGSYSPLLDRIKPSRPTVALNVISRPPMASAHVWLSATEEAQASNDCGTSFFYPFRIRRKPAREQSTHSLPEKNPGQISLITVGARLNSEIHGDWASNMLQICEQYNNVVWILVGGNGLLPNALQEIGAAKIITIPHVNDVLPFYEYADIYVNPPRLGGGFSVAEAMAEKLAVVSYHYSDGGNKIREHAAKDDQAYFNQLTNFISSRQAREENGEKMHDMFERTINLQHAGPSMQAAMTKAVSIYNEEKNRKA
jgi:glycosyltransferase involved in cell wall biosynthesis